TGTESPLNIRDELLRTLREVERQLGHLRRTLERQGASRDLVREIEELLATTPALTTPEIATAIIARESVVREVLRQNPARFQRVRNIRGRSPQARCWLVASAASTTQPDVSAELLEAQG